MIDAKSLVLTHFSGKLEGSLYGPSVRSVLWFQRTCMMNLFILLERECITFAKLPLE